MTPRVFLIAAAFGELGNGGWHFVGPWVAPLPEIASAQAVATYMQQNPAVAQLPLTSITVSEVPVEAIRAWLGGIDKAAEAEKKAEAEKVVRWPVVGGSAGAADSPCEHDWSGAGNFNPTVCLKCGIDQLAWDSRADDHPA